MLTRRTLMSAGMAGLALPSFAQFRVEISGVGATQLPIDVPRFRDEDKAPQQVSAIIRADLERSGFFRPIEASGVAIDETARPAMGDWRGRSVDALAAGSVQRLADGRFDVRFKLWDVVKGSEIGGQASAVDPADLRLAAHRIADYIYEKIGNDRGFLVLADNYYPGWKAYVNGKKTNILRVNYNLRSIYMPAGNNTVTFSFDPLSFRIGSAITCSTLLGIVLFFLAWNKRRA